MSLNNRMYQSLLLRKPSREGVAAALFGRKAVSMERSTGQANASAFFSAAEMSRATYDGGDFVFDGGGIGLGVLPDYKDILKAGGSRQFAGGDPPNILGTTPDAKVWGDGITSYVPNFDTEYANATRIGANIERLFLPSTPIVKKLLELDQKLVSAMNRANENYYWNKACTWEKDYWHNCRTPDQVDRLKTAYANVRDALREYPPLENEAAVAPREWRRDYNLSVEQAFKEANPNASALDIERRFFREQAVLAAKATGDARNGVVTEDVPTTGQRRGASTAGGMPGWALPVAGVALLGILAGGLYFTRKKG